MKKDYYVYYSCPHCPRPCMDKEIIGNECIRAETKKEARDKFNLVKPCRYQKIIKIDTECITYF